MSVFILNACDTSQGTVTDEVTGKPIADAQIMVFWTGTAYMPVQSSSQCFGLMSTTSDTNGRFNIPAFSGKFNPIVRDRHRQKSVVASGYRQTRNTNSDELRYSMRPLADPRTDPEGAREDFKYFDVRPGLGCGDEKLVLGYFKVRLYNLQLLATSEKEQEYLRGELFGVEAMEFGERIAEANRLARNLELKNRKQNRDGQK